MAYSILFLSLYVGKIILIGYFSKFTNARITDTFHFLVMPLNSLFQRHPILADIIISFDQFTIDFFAIYFGIIYLFKPYPFMITSVMILFSLRILSYNLTLLPLIQPYIFHFSYPSLTVPQEETNDLFFGGHVGLYLLFHFFCKNTGHKFLVYSSQVLVVVTLLILWLTGGHYLNDNLFGIMVALYSDYWSRTDFLHVNIFVARTYVKLYNGIFGRQN